MRPFVDFEIFAPRKHFAAAGERAWEGLLAGVHPNVVHQLVFGFEGLTLARTVLPQTRVIRLLRSANMFDSDVGHYVVNAGKHLLTDLLRAVLSCAATTAQAVVHGISFDP